MATRSKVRGVIRIRRALKILPEAVRADLSVQMRTFGERVLADQRGRAPVLQKPDRRRSPGQLRDALKMTFSERALRLRVGLHRSRRKDHPFWGFWMQYGRVGGLAKRGKGKAAGRPRRVGALPPRPFLFNAGGRHQPARQAFRRQMQGTFSRALTASLARAGGAD